MKKALKKDSLKVKVEKLKNKKIASVVTISEDTRRMQDMMKMYNMQGMNLGMPDEEVTLVLNQNHPLIDALMHKDLTDDKKALLCHQLYDLAQLANHTLSPDAMHDFLDRSNKILGMMI